MGQGACRVDDACCAPDGGNLSDDAKATTCDLWLGGASVTAKSAVSAPPQPPPRASRLVEVPKFFSRVNIGSTYTASSDDCQILTQQGLKCFIRNLSAGVSLDVLLDDGTAVAGDCYLDVGLQTLVLQVAGRVREVPLDSIELVAQAKDSRWVPDNVGRIMDGCCVVW
mmetsp:Transcript_35031/g.91702  ORF Transcript_35031/g.91702 Transcript_35031/m.91702 type:complete len:168 (-) Transcript_35031:43-546(-)